MLCTITPALLHEDTATIWSEVKKAGDRPLLLWTVPDTQLHLIYEDNTEKGIFHVVYEIDKTGKILERILRIKINVLEEIISVN